MGVGTIESLRAERDRYVALAFSWGDLLLEVGADLTIGFAAGATEAFMGVKPAALRGRNLREFVAPADGPLVAEALNGAAHKHRIQDQVVRLRNPQGGFLPMSLAGYCLDPAVGRFYLALRRGTAEAKAAAVPGLPAGSAELRDPPSFVSLAAHLLQSGEAAEVTMLALPGIAALTGRLEEPARETLMRRVGDTLRAGSLGGNAAAAIGEGKFSLIHAVGADLDGLMTRVREAVRQADPAGQGLEVVATTLPMGDVAEVSEEDLARGLMYAINRFREAKGAGFNLKSLSDSIAGLVDAAVKDVNGFKHVVARAEFDVALQPIVDIASGEIHHFEALCRFHANAGESPYRYITFAEETGLIPQFDLAMLQKVIELLDKYPRNSDRFRVAVNVSGHSIGDPWFVGELRRTLRANIWTQGKLLFEVTESARMTDLDAANAFFQGLRSWGYEVCLDDFGAGAASFQYLSSLEVDVVKLDGSAVRNAQKAAKGRAFLSALTDLCRRLRVHTIAEMVDSPESLQFVRDCGCDYVQGFLFGKPSKNVKDFDPLPMKTLFKARQRG